MWTETEGQKNKINFMKITDFSNYNCNTVNESEGGRKFREELLEKKIILSSTTLTMLFFLVRPPFIWVCPSAIKRGSEGD